MARPPSWKNRTLISIDDLRRDGRTLGLVLIGAGLLGVVLEGQWEGVVAASAGIAIFFLARTRA